MPELPEVEVVRLGLADHVVGARLGETRVLDPRSIRRHAPGAAALVDALRDRVVTAAARRGKYLWLVLDDADALVAHLGMSGQLLVQPAGAPAERHLRVAIGLPGERELRFVDQRVFGHLFLSAGGVPVPAEIAHIALDPLDPRFDIVELTARMRRRRTGLKRALLDQSLVSGIGNIYADEALWEARLHYARPTATLRTGEIARVMAAAQNVMRRALRAGGTSFDALYVNVNGQSGYFDRSLNAYGREGLPCPRCGEPIRREAFMNRSSYICRRCQPRPRRPGS